MMKIEIDKTGKESAIRILNMYLKDMEWSGVVILTKDDEEYQKDENQTRPKKIETCIVSILKELGISVGLKGYPYLKDALMICVENDYEVPAMTKVLYPEIAKKHNTKPSRVERGIRYAIEISMERADPECLERIFGCSYSADKGKATNREFISVVLEEIKSGGIKSEY